MAAILIRYWAGARAAAGVDSEQLEAATVASALELAVSDGRGELGRVIERSSLLLDGVVVHDQSTALTDGQTLEVLPPFAGGAF
jgi:molybdopterin synthase sulfur carrier subunit